jgi:hypothetical protein
MLNWGLYGVLTVQVCELCLLYAFLPPTEHAIADLYWIAFQDDRRIHQVLVYGLCILETAQSISLTHDGFQQFVYGFGDPASVNDSRDVWANTCILDGFGECECLVIVRALRGWTWCNGQSHWFSNAFSQIEFVRCCLKAWRIQWLLWVLYWWAEYKIYIWLCKVIDVVLLLAIYHSIRWCYRWRN